jgi:hypothetical protein
MIHECLFVKQEAIVSTYISREVYDYLDRCVGTYRCITNSTCSMITVEYLRTFINTIVPSWTNLLLQ